MDDRQQLVSRRRFLRRVGALGGLTAAGVLAACNVPTATPPTPAPAKPADAPKPAATAAAAAQPAAPAQPAAAPAKVVGSGFNWQRFKGQTVRMEWTDNEPTIGGLRPHFGEFEELTGMEPVYEGYGTA